MTLAERAARHAALGDTRRLQIVDYLATGDRTVAELADLVEMPGNLLAHHLDVLDGAGLIARRVSEGDRRLRYVTLNRSLLPSPPPVLPTAGKRVAFVCTHNSARSQFAAAIWARATGDVPFTAGTHPAGMVHPKAARVAAEYGFDMGDQVPSGYNTLPRDLDLLVSVCDRAREAGVPESAMTLHWSVPDPVAVGTLTAFRCSFEEIARRVEHLTGVPRWDAKWWPRPS